MSESLKESLPLAGYGGQGPMPVNAGLLAFLAVAVPIAAIALATSDDLDGLLARILATAVGVGCGVLFALAARHYRRRFPRRAFLVVAENALELDAAEIFIDPFELPRSEIRVIAFDPDRDWWRSLFRNRRRFQISPGEDKGKSSLWLLVGYTWWRPSRIPIFSSTIRSPNTAVLLERPTPAPKLRWEYRIAAALDGSCPRDIRKGAPIQGFVLRLKHVERARIALASWGVVRDLTIDDLPERLLRR